MNPLQPARFVQQVGTYLKPCNVVNRQPDAQRCLLYPSTPSMNTRYILSRCLSLSFVNKDLTLTGQKAHAHQNNARHRVLPNPYAATQKKAPPAASNLRKPTCVITFYHCQSTDVLGWLDILVQHREYRVDKLIFRLKELFCLLSRYRNLPNWFKATNDQGRVPLGGHAGRPGLGRA